MKNYMTKAEQARQMFIMHLGLSHAFRKGASSSVRVREFHIRFIHEALPGAGLRIETAMTSLSEDSLSLIHIMYHMDGRPAATIHETLEHVYIPTENVFRWPARVKDAAKDYMTPLPDMARGKGLSANAPMNGANLETLQKWGCPIIGRGVFTESETDIFDRVSAQSFVGRLSDSVIGFTDAWPSMETEDWRKTGIIGVMLETRYRFHTYAEAGLPYVIFSGLASVSDRVRQLIHHFVNPYTGRPYMSVIAVNGLIDTNKRKMAYPSEENRRILESRVIENLHA